MLSQSSPLALRMADFASRQHGIVDLDELDRAKVPRSTVKLWVRSGHLFRLHRGVFSVVPPRMLTIEGKWLAAVKACRPDSLLSHGPAGQLAGLLDRRHRYALHVSIAGRAKRNPPGIVVHRPRHLDPIDTTTMLWIPTTTVTRTIWDLAAALPSQQTRKAFEKAERHDWLSRPRMDALLTASPTHKGAGFIHQLLSERLLPRLDVHSWLEELLEEICHDNDLPMPVANVPVLDYTVDFLWPKERFVIEADGGDHEEPTQRDKDNLRDSNLQRAGFLVRRYSSRAMSRRKEAAAEILEIVLERRALVGA